MDINTFIDAVFHSVESDEMVIVAKAHPRGHFEHHRYTGQDLPAGPWYFNVSTVVATEGKARRRIVDCRALYLIVLDDIGGKYDAPPVAPSYVMETSPGNYQWAYFLTEPIVDMERALALWGGFADAGLTDHIGQANRVVRLPGSINTKEGNDNFEAKVVEWNPERAFDIEQLAADCGVVARVKGAAPVVIDSADDPVVPWLLSHLGGQVGADGMIELGRCPWESEHTTPSGGTAYFPLGFQNRMTRGFKCLHSHCVDRSVHDLLLYMAEAGGGAFTVTGNEAIIGKQAALMSITPRLDAAGLPDVKRTAAGLLAARQMSTGLNIEWAMRQLGVRARINMQTKEHELHAEWSDDCARVFEVLNNKLQQVNIESRSGLRHVIAGMGEGYHPIVEQLSPWDGVDRWCQLAATVAVSEDSQDAWVGLLRRWILQAVQAWRSWEKPSQVGSVLVFVGKQGIGKSRWLESLHPDVLAGRHLDVKAKDSMVEALSAPIVELGELETTFKQSDVAALKAFLTTTRDKWRAPYAEQAETWPRCTVFAASVNTTDFLQDNENRRFWPVAIESCNPDHGIDMMQIYAQAAAELDAGDRWWLEGEELDAQVEAAERHRSHSETEDAFDNYFNEARMKMPKKDWTHGNALDLQKCMGLSITHPRARSELVSLTSQLFGKKRKRCNRPGWWMPITKGERASNGCPVKGDSAPPLWLV